MNYYSLILLGQLNFFYEVFIPMFILMRRQEKRRFIWLRLAVVAALSVSLVFMPFLAIGPFGMSYLIDLALAFFAGLFIFKVSPLDVLFYVVEGFAIQHLMWDMLFIIFESIGELSQAAALGIYIPLYVVEYVLMFLFMPVPAKYAARSFINCFLRVRLMCIESPFSRATISLFTPVPHCRFTT